MALEHHQFLQLALVTAPDFSTSPRTEITELLDDLGGEADVGHLLADLFCAFDVALSACHRPFDVSEQLRVVLGMVANFSSDIVLQLGKLSAEMAAVASSSSSFFSASSSSSSVVSRRRAGFRRFRDWKAVNDVVDRDFVLLDLVGEGEDFWRWSSAGRNCLDVL